MKYRKNLLATLFISIFLSSLPAFAAVKSGATCPKVGKVVFQSNSEFRCAKKGKKLVWVKRAKAVALPAPSPSPTPTVSPSPSPTATPIPSPSPTETVAVAITPVPTVKPLIFAETLWSKGENGVFPIEKQVYEIPRVIPTNWQDVYEKRLGIPYQAWSAISKNIVANTSKIGSVEMLVGPNTEFNYPNLESVMELVSRAVPTGRNPKNVRVFVFNFKDAGWADQSFKKLYADESSRFKRMHADPVWAICPVQREVCFAQSFVDSNLNGVLFMGMIDKGSREQLNQTYSEYARTFRGQLIAHEYLHTIEAIHLGERRYGAMERTPTWFSQGAAVFMEGTAPNYQSFDNFMRFRAVDSKLFYFDCPYSFCIKVDANLIEDYISLSHQEKNWDNFPYGMKYEMSARVAEILVALKGPDSMIRVFDEIGKGRRFDEAFETVYGIRYELAKPIIARIVADQFANGR